MAKKIDLDGLEFFKGKENAMVADEYSSSKTYALGDYAYHAGTLYKCTTAITTAEAWTVGHWTAAKLADDLASQSEKIIQFDNAMWITDSQYLSTWETGYVNTSGSNATSSAYYRIYYNIDANKYKYVQVTGANSGAASPKSIAFITFIDSNNNRTVAYTIESTDSTVHTEKVEVPATAVCVLVCVTQSYASANGFPVVTLFRLGNMDNMTEESNTITAHSIVPYYITHRYIADTGIPTSSTSTGWNLYKLDVSNVNEVRIRTRLKDGNSTPIYSILSKEFDDVTTSSVTTSDVIAVGQKGVANTLNEVYVNIPSTGKTMLIVCGTDYVSTFEVIVYKYGYFPKYELLNHFDDSVNAVLDRNVAYIPKVDRYIFSQDIRNTFVMDSEILPAHAWDDDNGTYSAITTSQVYELYDALVSAHSDEMSSETIGTASDGETPIKVYRFTPKHCTAKYKIFRPKIMVNCATHGWEKCGTETMLMLLKILFDDWDTNPLLEVLRWDVDWVIVPVTNPYGFDHNTRKNYNGVDINRNYNRGWSKRVTDPTSQTYQGESALSEPEAVAIDNLIQTEKPVVGIDFHDFGNSESKLAWVGARASKFNGVSIDSYHLGQVLLDRVSRQVVKQFSFLNSIDPTSLGTLSDGTYPLGLTADAYFDHGALFAYTFEMCGMPTYEPNKKRFDDNHAIMCIEYFANFIANNLEQLYRVVFTKDAILASDDPDPEPD